MGRPTSIARPLAPAAADPVAAARGAHLRYVRAGEPGLQRRPTKGGFRYLDAAGRAVRDAQLVRRIRSLVIPPAWRQVWICADHAGHIQATGRDTRGRKQYRYHARWRAQRDDTKFARMLAFGRALPRIRAGVAADMARPGLPRDKVLATVVRLLETTLIRVGNEEYARTNHHYGLATLHDGHVRIQGPEVRFSFQGKSGKRHQVAVSDLRLARIVRRCRDVPGYQLFQYLDGRGRPRDVDAADVNDYIRVVAGQPFTAKDFRTWAGTVLAATCLWEEAAIVRPGRRLEADIKRAIESVAARLGNTAAVCRKSYVHPGVLEAYRDGERLPRVTPGPPPHGLRRQEAAVMALLRRHIDQDRRGDRLQRLLGRSLRRSPRHEAGPGRPSSSRRMVSSSASLNS